MIQGYIRKMKGALDPKTLKYREMSLTKFFNWCKKDDMNVRLKDIEDYKNELIGEGKIETAHLFVIHIRQYLRYLKRYDISENIASVKLKKRIPTYLSLNEVKKLYAESKKDELDHAIFMVLYNCGLRVSELTSLDIEDIDTESRKLIVRHGKFNKEREGIINDSTIKALGPFLSSDGALFRIGKNRITSRTVERRIKAMAKRAGIKKHVHPHTLRHTFATMLLNSDAKLPYIQSLMGHSSIASTQIYLHCDEKNLRKEHDKLPNLEDQ